MNFFKVKKSTNTSVEVNKAKTAYQKKWADDIDALLYKRQKNADDEILKICKILAKKGDYEISFKSAKKRFKDPTMVQPKIKGPELDPKKVQDEDSMIFYHASPFGTFVERAQAAGLKIVHKWEYKKKKNLWVATRFQVTFS